MIVDFSSDMTVKDILDYYYRCLTLGVEVDLKAIIPEELFLIIEDEDIICMGISGLKKKDKKKGIEEVSLIMPDYITSLDSYVLYKSEVIKEIILGNGFINLYPYCLGSSNVEKVSLSSNVNIYEYAMYGCECLTEVIGACIDKIDKFAFSQCKNLKRIDLSACKSIGSNAFSNCVDLNHVDLSSCEILEDNAFCNSGVESMVLPIDMECSDFAFCHMDNLKNVVIKGKEGDTVRVTGAYFSSTVQISYI